EARALPGDPNSVENTGWDRTFVKQQDGVVFNWNQGKSGPGQSPVEIYAVMYIAALAGIPIEWPKVTLSRGDARLQWGHKIRLHLQPTGAAQSASTMGLDYTTSGLTFRILKSTNSYN